MTLSTAYRDGWLAHRVVTVVDEPMENPYSCFSQNRSYQLWQRGFDDRAAKLPGDPYLEILDADMMG